MKFWTKLLITAAWLSLTTFAASAGATSTPTGFHGHVTIGPLQPVCHVGTPCDGPAKRVTLTFTKPNVVRRAVTTTTGAYRIVLPAGFYTVRANRGMRIKPARVWAHRGYDPKLNFAIDTGIR
ncbi:MAG TPA: hypothetical protein VFW85_04030 [Gaiellaceae bacterium]|nr:hypothetical protein [Gaiellaceae bacterium]